MKKKKRTGGISCRIPTNLEEALKAETESMGLTQSEYMRRIIENRHNKLSENELEQMNNNKPIFKVTIEKIVQHPIETIKSNFESEKELFDGTDGFLDIKLINIEKVVSDD